MVIIYIFLILILILILFFSLKKSLELSSKSQLFRLLESSNRFGVKFGEEKFPLGRFVTKKNADIFYLIRPHYAPSFALHSILLGTVSLQNKTTYILEKPDKSILGFRKKTEGVIEWIDKNLPHNEFEPLFAIKNSSNQWMILRDGSYLSVLEGYDKLLYSPDLNIDKDPTINNTLEFSIALQNYESSKWTFESI